jgi:hypothetical protein
MGNPVPLRIIQLFSENPIRENTIRVRIIQLFSENTIREIPESSKNTFPVPLKLSQDLSINP